MAIVNLLIAVLKLTFNYKAFSTKFHAHEMFGSREFTTVFRARQKSTCGSLLWLVGISALFDLRLIPLLSRQTLRK